MMKPCSGCKFYQEEYMNWEYDPRNIAYECKLGRKMPCGKPTPRWMFWVRGKK